MKSYIKIWSIIFIVLTCILTSCAVREIDGGYEVGFKRPGEETEKPQETRTSPNDSTPTPSPIPAQEEQLTVTLDLNKKEAYQPGEKLVITVRANQDCYLMLYDVSSNGHVAQIATSNSFLRQGRLYRIPDQTDSFDLQVSEPFGVSQLQAICTKNKITTFKKTYPNSEQFEQSVSQQVSILPSSQWITVKLEYIVGQETRKTEIAQSKDTSDVEKQQSSPISDPHWIADQNGCLVYTPNPQPNETITWWGECINGKANGLGELQWYVKGKDDKKYRGEMKEGMFNGIGILKIPGDSKWGGRRYSIYVGEWKNNKRNGLGFDYSTGESRVGVFQDDNFIAKDNRAKKYYDYTALEKELENAIKAKQHWIADQNGCKVYNPNPQPNETITWSGECINGKANGVGELRWYQNGKESSTNTGEFKEGYLNGFGVIKNSNGYSYEGEHKDFYKHGFGIAKFVNGDSYKGEWKEDKRHGIGIAKFPKSTTDGLYVGEWKNGKRNGLGYKEGTNAYSYGIFRDDNLIEKDSRALKYQDVATIEKEIDSAIDNAWCKTQNTHVLSSQDGVVNQEVNERCSYISDYLLARKIGGAEAKQRYVEKWIQLEAAGLLIDSLTVSEFQNIMQTRSFAGAKAFLARYPYK